ncbi:MAG: lrgA [Microbacterium sp.]|jgi:holin-like protein|uniref:CidA/LrgA family protein n=1 Tax=Microbacterium sp. TaxID=51671 RepID=UPI0026355C17|nr:CidA/LrgA family protein [Microbacterium sp.]MDF2562948.1 lrgA [Microbacterium sp.]
MGDADTGASTEPAKLTELLWGLGILLGLSMLGDVLARVLALPVPGAIIGMGICLALLLSPFGERIERRISRAGDVLIVALPFLLVPLAVGVVDVFDVVGDRTAGVLAALVGGWLVAFLVTVGVTLLLRRRRSA